MIVKGQQSALAKKATYRPWTRWGSPCGAEAAGQALLSGGVGTRLLPLLPALAWPCRAVLPSARTRQGQARLSSCRWSEPASFTKEQTQEGAAGALGATAPVRSRRACTHQVRPGSDTTLSPSAEFYYELRVKLLLCHRKKLPPFFRVPLFI